MIVPPHVRPPYKEVKKKHGITAQYYWDRSGTETAAAGRISLSWGQDHSS